MKRFLSSVSIAMLIMLMIVSTVGAANKPDKNKKAVKNVLAGKTYKGYGDYDAKLTIKFINKTQCVYSHMMEPPADCQKGTYVIKDENTVVCTFGGITYTDIDCTNPWPNRNEDGEEIPPEESKPVDWTLTTSDNFKTLNVNARYQDWTLFKQED